MTFLKKIWNFLLSPKGMVILIPAIALLGGLLVGSVIILITGNNPFLAFGAILEGSGVFPRLAYPGSGSQLKDFMNMLMIFSPYVFGALAVGVAFKTGMFNIGVAGQMIVAGFMATLVGYIAMPAIIHKPLVLLVGLIAGALWGAIPGLLKAKFKINEVLTCIMLNYTGLWLVNYFIDKYFLVQGTARATEPLASAMLRLPGIKESFGFEFSIGTIVAVVAAIAIWFILNKTTLGFELKAVGHNKDAARYAGMKVEKSTVLAMAISGGLAGLGGVCYYLGYATSISQSVLSTIGFDSIAVSLLANSSPLGILLSALFFSVIFTGKGRMSIVTSISQQIIPLIIGIILLFIASSTIIREVIVKRTKKNFIAFDKIVAVKEDDKYVFKAFFKQIKTAKGARVYALDFLGDEALVDLLKSKILKGEKIDSVVHYFVDNSISKKDLDIVKIDELKAICDILSRQKLEEILNNNFKQISIAIKVNDGDNLENLLCKQNDNSNKGGKN